MPGTRLFIYGTLKRGHCRHATLASQSFLGEVATAPEYRLWDLGEYPGLIAAAKQEAGRSIRGELWEVSDDVLAILDEIEGVAEGLYERRPIRLVDSQYAGVESYFYCLSITGASDCGHEWP